MKIIISHDVDHMSPWEHRTDAVVPKFLVRFGIEWLAGQTGGREVRSAVRSLVRGQWQRINELMDFDEASGVPSTFYVAVANGRKLCYPLDESRRWIKRISSRGFDVGVHGIGYATGADVMRELDRFRSLSGLDTTGVRMHNIGYSRSSVLLNEADVLRLKEAGYAYSSTTFSESGPWAVGNFWEFPVHLMDAHLFRVGRPWKTRTLEQAKNETGLRLTAAAERGVSHFSLLFHDAFFSDHYRDYRDWYIWLVEHLRSSGFPTCSYRQAVEELSEGRR